MRAIVCTAYGPPALVRIRATTVSAADCELRRFDFAPWLWLPVRLAFGIRRPGRRVLGQELAGDVDAVGPKVRSLRKGDRVFATTGIGLGAYAEYICLREHPRTGAITTMALGFLRKADIQRGQRVLVNGAGGSFGTFAVQLARDLARDRDRQRAEAGDAALDWP